MRFLFVAAAAAAAALRVEIAPLLAIFALVRLLAVGSAVVDAVLLAVALLLHATAVAPGLVTLCEG